VVNKSLVAKASTEHLSNTADEIERELREFTNNSIPPINVVEKH
jgi:hypothetical protein